MRTLCLLFAICAAGLLSAEPPPQTLEEQLNRDNPKVIAFLLGLDEAQTGQKVKGVTLSDGTNELKGATLLGVRTLEGKRQHVYLFKTADGLRAYTWVEKGGKPLSIPKEPGGSPGEDAYVLSGDIYTFTEVAPGDGVVILTGATKTWLDRLK